MGVKLSDVICEYGQAFRSNWSDVDGRGVRSDMEEISSYVDGGRLVLSEDEAKKLRNSLGICPKGKGHWSEDCDDDCWAD